MSFQLYFEFNHPITIWWIYVIEVSVCMNTDVKLCWPHCL